MKDIWTGNVGQVAGKYAENAPTAAVCCNACRTCVTTNVVGIGMAVAGGAAIAVARFAKRIVPRFAKPA